MPAPAAVSTAPEEPLHNEAGKKRTPRQKPVPVALPVPVAPGVLSIESNPAGARVQLDGNDLGIFTPYTVSGLPAGEHLIVIAKVGYAAERRSVQVRPGERSSLSVSLNELEATITVSSRPDGASIFLEGRDTGRVTPATLAARPGQHHITVAKNGFFEASNTLECGAGLRCEFAPQLVPKGHAEEIKSTGKFKRLFGANDAAASQVLIRTNPKGAQILVNGRPMDKTSPAEFSFPQGNYEITLSLPGYKTVHRMLTVTSGKNTVDERLEPGSQ